MTFLETGWGLAPTPLGRAASYVGCSCPHPPPPGLSQEMEPLILEKGDLLLRKISKSDEDVDMLFKKVEGEPDLESHTIEVGAPW
jgi:hypothetical protein